MSSAILEVQQVSKRFGGVRAVHRASLSVPQGAVISLIGPNGAGKTTLFNTITGLIEPTEGTILFDRGNGLQPIQGRRPDQVHRLGISRTFQNIRLFANLSALENVKLGAHCHGRTGLLGAMLRLPWSCLEDRRMERRALTCLRFVGLAHDCHHRAASLPYGHQRRLEIARALANGPSLLLLDEPAAGMNPTETEALTQLIRRVRDEGVTIFLIEHDMRLVMSISDYVYVLDHGEIISEGKPDAVRNDPRVIEAYLGRDAVAIA